MFASDDSGAHAARLRRHRHLRKALDWGLHLSRGASGRPELRNISCEFQRSGGASRRKILWNRAHSGRGRDPADRCESGVSIYTRLEMDMVVKTNDDLNPARYMPVQGYWDEALLSSGMPRRHWRKLFVELGRLGLRQLSRRWQTGQRLIDSQGIT